MTIPLETARSILLDFSKSRIENIFAQAHAKHILQEVGEKLENFPEFDSILEDKITFAAYSLLAASCSMIEQSDNLGLGGLEKAALLLQNAHSTRRMDNSRERGFHIMVSSMAFYAAGQYSRAYVGIRNIENHTIVAGIIAAFIRKDMKLLIQRINEVLIQEVPIFDDETDFDDFAITTTIARSLSIVIEYIYTGASDYLNKAEWLLKDAEKVAACGHSPAQWWIVRLLRMMIKNLSETSLWTVLPPFFTVDNQELLGRYIQLLSFSKIPVFELWTSQIAALPLALESDNLGAVINLRTSAGKTRVAELAILKTLSSHPNGKILYLAPFRSLALEVEKALGEIFSQLGFRVSHLYGGSRVSSVDTEIAEEAAIIISTPEKARALFRGTPELFTSVKLIIVDEGHLIGTSERDVKNELFIDHLRIFAQNIGARMLLLSAVLPNPQHIAEWITKDPNNVITSEWKPAAERFGFLRWNGIRVRIDWIGEVKSFNPKFVEAKPLGFTQRRNLFPKLKNEAVAATAVRLAGIGPVMIFAGKASSVSSIAKSVLLALGENPVEHSWPEREWNIFNAVCNEELLPDAIEVLAAKHGVICHSNKLTPQVRLATEYLMRSYPPKVIIATTTLGQGVNVGISSIIIASPYIGQDLTINKRDFWNICGRAGRAFVDGEGKILYTVDESRERWQVKKDVAMARKYFDFKLTDPVESGLLYVVNLLKKTAEQADISLDILIQMVLENDFTQIHESEKIVTEVFDILDDELLALHEDTHVNPLAEEPSIWVDRIFRGSLACIQVGTVHEEISADDILRLLAARVEATIRRIPEAEVRKTIVSSSLPLSVAMRLYTDLDFFRGVVDDYTQSDCSIISLVTIVRNIEQWAKINAISVIEAELVNKVVA